VNFRLHGPNMSRREDDNVPKEPFERHMPRYDGWFERHREVYAAELRAVSYLLPKSGTGVEIGAGTGRFAAPLGIGFGVDPSMEMMKVARTRGLRMTGGVAEALPLKCEVFDFALMVTTICFVGDVASSLSEAYRVIRPGGRFINGFVDRESRLGRIYEQHKEENVFYRIATFYSVDEVLSELHKSGFRDPAFVQTIFQSLDGVGDDEPLREGYGEGCFVVVGARKPGPGEVFS